MFGLTSFDGCVTIQNIPINGTNTIKRMQVHKKSDSIYEIPYLVASVIPAFDIEKMTRVAGACPRMNKTV